MIKVNSTVKIYSPVIWQLTRAQITALEKTTEAVHTDIVQEEVVPRDTGALQNEKTFVDYDQAPRGKTSIVTEGPYARRLYYHPEFNFQFTENSKARGAWYEDWLPGGRKENFARRAYKKFYREEAGL